MMPRSDLSGVKVPKLLTPVGGMILSIAVGGGLWSALVVGMHAFGMF